MLGRCNAADQDASGDLSFGDVTAFIAAFNSPAFEPGDPVDTNGDGLVNFGDVTTFIDAFNSGCP